MARLILKSYEAKRSTSGFIQIILHTGGGNPFPSRTVDFKTTAQALDELEAYAAEAKETGKPMQVSMMLHPQDRAPRGFRAALHTLTVNV